MSDLPIQPLQGQFKIADPETGLPTQEFLQWTKAVTDLLPTQEEALAAIEGAGLTPLSARILLGDNTRFGGEIEIDADTQAILDVISDVQGSILYRGATEWASLAPGTAGHFLRTAGAGADPTWAAAGGGGGGGGYFSGWSAGSSPGSVFTGNFATHGVLFTAEQNVSITAVQLTMNPAGAGETYVATIATTDTLLASAEITSIAGVSGVTNAIGTGAQIYKMAFGSPVPLTTGVNYLMAVSRTDGSGTTAHRLIPTVTCEFNGPLNKVPDLILRYNTTSLSVAQTPSATATGTPMMGAQGTL